VGGAARELPRGLGRLRVGEAREGAARWIALIALLGWPWMLAEPFVRRFLERRKRGVGKFFANMVSQWLQAGALILQPAGGDATGLSDLGELGRRKF